jgi:hypothetical protein
VVRCADKMREAPTLSVVLFFVIQNVSEGPLAAATFVRS